MKIVDDGSGGIVLGISDGANLGRLGGGGSPELII